eukprot:GILI01017340.1.p1 GENE.GILI01017340.1~~GILI01017340.1.p1  ORF type:complete len:133 (+),score=12.76 GILI01017340.1:2-400(+)
MRINVTASSNCGGNCPAGNCPSCPCGTSPSRVDIAAWCARYSWNQANCACIMKDESGGNIHAVNYNAGQSASHLWDVGLWQINNFNWNVCSGGAAPCEPEVNLKCAIDVYKWGGNTWKLWSTCSICGACASS